MQVRKIGVEKKTGRAVLEVEKTSPGFMNAIRRAIVEFVPTMAIEYVDFQKNDSILYDEIVANRLGLIPLKTDLKSYVEKDKCTCNAEGCAKCTLKLTLKTKATGVITSGQMKSKDPKVIPVDDGIPIAKLLKDQEMAFEATAQLGRGDEHVKWSPGHVWYNYKYTIKLDAKKIKDPKAFVEESPMDIFKATKQKVEIDQKKVDAWALTIKTLDAWQHDALTVEPMKDTFTLHIEPWGQLTPKEMVQEATNILQEQCKEFTNALNEAKK